MSASIAGRPDRSPTLRGGDGYGRLLGLPLPGITCSVLNNAIRQVEGALLDAATPGEREPLAEVIAAVALAVGRRTPAYVVERRPRPPAAVVGRVLEVLRAALLRVWRERSAAASAFLVLRHVAAVEELRETLARTSLQDFTAPLNGPGGADALAEVLHDLRSPLSAIRCLAERLELGGSGVVNDLQQRQLRLIHIAAVQLGMVADDAIDASHDGDVRCDDDTAPLSVTKVFNAVSNIVRPVAEEKNLEVYFVRPEDDYRVGREGVLRRVLLNLVTNALKFTHMGWVEVAAADRADARVEFSVRDTGPGIRPEAVEHLFRPFRRAATDQPHRFSRTGLGLALCRRMVEQLGGTLRHESPPGGGTRFWFEADLPPLTRP